MVVSLFFIALFLLYSPLTVAQDNPAAEGPYAQLIIRGATLINGNGAPPQGPIDVVIENNTIKKVQVVGYPGVPINEARRPKLKAGGKEIDATGMYLLPGFIDMHGHIGGTAQGADWDYVFKLWLAHGVTTVREPSGRGIEYTLDLKKRSEKNEIVAPRIFAYTGFGQGKLGVNTDNPLNAIQVGTAASAFTVVSTATSAQLGIGTTSPDFTLDVRGDSNIDGKLTVNNNTVPTLAMVIALGGL